MKGKTLHRALDILLAQLPVIVLLTCMTTYFVAIDTELSHHMQSVAAAVRSISVIFAFFCAPFVVVDLFLMPFVFMYL